MKAVCTVLAALVLVLLAGCSGSDGGNGGGSGRSTSDSQPASKADPAPTVKVGQPFTNSGFRITVTKVVLNQARFPGAPGVVPDPNAQLEPKKGQFVLVYVTVTNIDKEPHGYDNAAKSTITDATGTSYAECECDIVNQDVESRFRAEQQPGQTVMGILAFDVPKSVTSVDTITIQPEAVIGGDNERTRVAVD